MHATMAGCDGQVPKQRASTSALLQHTLPYGCPPSLVRRSASTAKSSVCLAPAHAVTGLNDEFSVGSMQRFALAKAPAVNPPLLLMPPARRGSPDRVRARRSDCTAVCRRRLHSSWLPIGQPKITLGLEVLH